MIRGSNPGLNYDAGTEIIGSQFCGMNGARDSNK